MAPPFAESTLALHIANRSPSLVPQFTLTPSLAMTIATAISSTPLECSTALVTTHWDADCTTTQLLLFSATVTALMLILLEETLVDLTAKFTVIWFKRTAKMEILSTPTRMLA